MAAPTGIAELRAAPELVTPPRSHFARVIRCAVPAFVLAGVLLLPFLHKAYTIDDPIFLTGAQQVLRDPLHPSNFSMAWNTDYPQRASEFVANGAAMYYLLAPVAAAGAKEWQAHLWMLLIFCCGLCATVSVALRLGFTDREAAWSGVLVASTPAVLALASTSMPDVPAMTLATLAVDRMLKWKESQRWVHGVAMAVLLTCAALTRSHLLLLGAACLIWLYEPKSRDGIVKQLWPLALVPVLMVLLTELTRDPQAPAGGLFAAAATLSSPEGLVRNLISFFTHFALVMPFALPFVVISRRRWIAVASVVIAVFVTLLFHGTIPLAVPFAVLSAVLVMTEVIWPAFAERRRLQLFLAAWMVLAIVILEYTHLPSKYLVPSAPAVAFLLLLKLRDVSGKTRRAVLTGCAVLGIALSLAIIKADANLAGLWRKGAAEIIAPRVARGERVWFAGNWGFYWYAEQAGARQLLSDERFPPTGEIIVTCSSGPHDNGLKVGGRGERIEYIAYSEPGGRIFGGHPRTGFYSNWWGHFPWTWDHDVITSFSVWRVKPVRPPAGK